MQSDREFEQVNARHVVNGAGVHVEFINAHELEYRHQDLVVRFDAERAVDRHGYPDGRILDSRSFRTNGETIELKGETLAEILETIKTASKALRTKIAIE